MSKWCVAYPNSVQAAIDALKASAENDVRTYGIARTERILLAFDVERLWLATDYPDNRHLPPDAIYAAYFDIHARMHFTEEETQRIAYQNAKDLFEAQVSRC